VEKVEKWKNGKVEKEAASSSRTRISPFEVRYLNRWTRAESTHLLFILILHHFVTSFNPSFQHSTINNRLSTLNTQHSPFPFSPHFPPPFLTLPHHIPSFSLHHPTSLHLTSLHFTASVSSNKHFFPSSLCFPSSPLTTDFYSLKNNPQYAIFNIQHTLFNEQ
jgi:hypothetical protein